MANEARTEASARADAAAPENIPATGAGGEAPKDDQIKERAYLIWINEGRPHGRELDHWLHAKWELEQERD